jgi:hypothetical protein
MEDNKIQEVSAPKNSSKRKHDAEMMGQSLVLTKGS